MKNNKNDLDKRTKSPILRRCKTTNNTDFDKFKNNLNNLTLNNNDKNILFTHNNNIKDKLNIINNERKNSFKYSITNDGSTVSVHGNTINGLPIIQGVCSKCINSELIKLKNINQKLYTYNNIKNARILETEKEKLIEIQHLNTENDLNKPLKEKIREKVIINYLKKEQNLKNKKCNYNNIKTEIDKCLSNNYKISKFSVPSIGLEKFKNKYLPTKEQYINNLNEQILQKKKAQEKDCGETNLFINL